MILNKYTPEQIDVAKKFISPDAFMFIVMDKIMRNESLSVVGFGDGERSVMKYAKGAGKASYLDDAKYLKEYGLTGANLKAIGLDLYFAANEADYFCPLISGLYMNNFDTISLVHKRDVYVERLFPYAWFYMGREKELMKCDDIAIVCRDSANVAQRMADKYGVEVEPIEYSSWQDYSRALKDIEESTAKLILCSVGQSGKYLSVEAAKFNKVVLDIGSAMINKWQWK